MTMTGFVEYLLITSLISKSDDLSLGPVWYQPINFSLAKTHSFQVSSRLRKGVEGWGKLTIDLFEHIIHGFYIVMIQEPSSRVFLIFLKWNYHHSPPLSLISSIDRDQECREGTYLRMNLWFRNLLMLNLDPTRFLLLVSLSLLLLDGSDLGLIIGREGVQWLIWLTRWRLRGLL